METAQLEMELEKKFDVPAAESHEGVIIALIDLVADTGAMVRSTNDSCRHFQYFDTPEREFLATGNTLRCVTGRTDPRGGYWYNWKMGAVNTPERKELEHWSGAVIPPAQLPAAVGIADAVATVDLVAEAPTRHVKWLVAFDGTLLEITFATFFNRNNEVLFREIEVELKKGLMKTFETFLQIFRRHFSEDRFPMVLEQKYARVMNAIAHQ